MGCDSLIWWLRRTCSIFTGPFGSDAIGRQWRTLIIDICEWCISQLLCYNGQGEVQAAANIFMECRMPDAGSLLGAEPVACSCSGWESGSSWWSTSHRGGQCLYRPAVPGMRRWSSFPREVHPTGPQQSLSPEVAEMLREEIEPEETCQETEGRILQKRKDPGGYPRVVLILSP